MNDSQPEADFRHLKHHVPFIPEGLPYVLTGMFVTFTFALLDWAIPAILSAAVTVLMVHFFRDPVRWSNAGPGDVVSPADGRIIVVEKTSEPRFTGQPCWKISIFMNVFDVHVNRVPISGRIADIFYQKGRFLAADKAKASKENEQNWIRIETASGASVVVTQVAGLIARRIVCWPQVGDTVRRGERFGMIRFGSRLDLYIPSTGEVLVRKGQKVFAGETILCRIP
ncbi:phosphatidylserine decarboxylase family protein [Desulfosoma caldarium]|uniref:Phosphatidylserine decarboxylase proenzyme n=1 Tax=Desulfosoma caldarium TaxID=610254 RepID=A0A3N1UUX3_9BACT|nr:phosphatidylserine decarboxylase family protein [Desulfosoma caldarium]ROQ92337.1 phosphatidylserine decarboxylase [Desulfosoma caldarium]